MTPSVLQQDRAEARATQSIRSRGVMVASEGPASRDLIGAVAVDSPRAQREVSPMTSAARKRAIRNVRMMRALDRIAAKFDEVGVPLMALKGAVLNMTVYDGPDQRPMDDLDLLVRETDVKQALSLLKDLGGVSGETLVHGDFFPRYHYEIEYAVGRIYPVRIDLHVRPFRPLRYARVMPTDALWTSARHMRIDKGVILVPSDEEMLIHLAAHAAIHACARRSWLVDLQRWVAWRGDAIDWTQFVTTAAHWRLALPVHGALVLAERELGSFLPADVVARLSQEKANWRDRLALRQAPRDAERPVMHVLVSAVTTPGWLFVLGYLRRVLFPGRAHMGEWYSGRHWGWLPIAHLARCVRPLWSRIARIKRA